jgi:hypothetical protein
VAAEQREAVSGVKPHFYGMVKGRGQDAPRPYLRNNLKP